MSRAHLTEATSPDRPPTSVPAIEGVGLSRRYRGTRALSDATLRVMPGEIRALLGPNGAGKTTLIRLLAGLATPDAGELSVLGTPHHRAMTRDARAAVGLIPSGDRSFYLRLSGLENLVFFARLYGLSRREAIARARDALEHVGLSRASDKRAGEYSHGMQKRLSIGRALLLDPPVLLVDEATHDLDPEAARRVRTLVADAARERGTAVVWATQRLDEIRGFADLVTVLHEGEVRFEGTVPELMALTVPDRFVVHVRDGRETSRASEALRGFAHVETAETADPAYFRMTLTRGTVLGDAVAALVANGIAVLACREERSEIESAFLRLTEEDP